MAFTVKNWVDFPSTTTPISAAALEDLETRVTAYTDTIGAAAAGGVTMVALPTGNATTDRAAIQTALSAASAGDVVKLQAGSIYEVNQAATKSFTVTSGTTTLGYCLQIPTGVTLDLNGSTIKYASGAGDCVLLCNTNTAGAADANIGLTGYGTIDGRNFVLTACTCIWFHGVTGMTLDFRIANTARYGLYMDECYKVAGLRIHSDTCAGQPIVLGNPGDGTPGNARYVSDSWFGSLVSNNVTEGALPFNEPGNPVYAVMANSTIDSIKCTNHAAGVKLDRPTVDLAIGTVTGDTSTTSNSGLKLQGDGSGYPKRIHVSQVHMRNQFGAGLWMDLCYDCSVGTFVGWHNNTDNSASDLWIGGVRDTVVHARSSESVGTGVVIRDYAVDYNIGTLDVYNANTSNTASTNGVTVGATSKGKMGTVTIIDDRGTPRHDRGFRQTTNTSVCIVDKMKIRGWTTAAYTLASGSAISAKSLLPAITSADTFVSLGLTTEIVPVPQFAPVMPGMVLPIHGNYIVSGGQTGVINRMYTCRVKVPQTGFLRGFAFFIVATSGNCILAAYDAGTTTPSVYTKLGDSGSVAVGTINTYQDWDPGASAIPVTAGQDLFLAVMFDNTTASMGRGNSPTSGSFLWPTNYLPGAVLPKLSWIRDAGSFAMPTTVTEANALTNITSFVFLGRVTA